MLTATDGSDLLREPVRGGVAYPALAALPGVEQVGALLAGRAPAPPVARLTGPSESELDAEADRCYPRAER